MLDRTHDPVKNSARVGITYALWKSLGERSEAGGSAPQARKFGVFTPKTPFCNQIFACLTFKGSLETLK